MPHPLIVLGIDTALGSCSAAIGDEEGVMASRYEEHAGAQAERLVPMMEAVIGEAGLSPPALQRIAVTVGPGSFTGTRIGLAAARAMGLSLGVPVLGVTTLAALAEAAPPGHSAIVAFEARRGQLYLQMFGPDRTPLTEPLALSPEAAASCLPDPPAPVFLLGSGAPALRPLLPEDRFTIAELASPRFPAAAGFLNLAARETASPGAMPRPLYLRPAHTQSPERLTS